MGAAPPLKAIFDSNLFIDFVNLDKRRSLIVEERLVRYLSSVVEMEVLTGARRRSTRQACEQMFRRFAADGRTVAPSPGAYRRAARVLARLSQTGHEIRRSSLVADVLIALTAREIGATLYTLDSDFEAIRRIEHFALEVVR